MDGLIWTGAAISCLGLVGLVLSIIKVNRARKAGLDDEALRAAVQKVLPLNLGSLFLSVIGLMMVIVGIFLGSNSCQALACTTCRTHIKSMLKFAPLLLSPIAPYPIPQTAIER